VSFEVMMEECRLSMLQRKRLQDFVDKGEPLPLLTKTEHKQTHRTAKSLFDVKQIRIGRKRTKLEITNMGAYEMEKVKPKPGGILQDCCLSNKIKLVFRVVYCFK